MCNIRLDLYSIAPRHNTIQDAAVRLSLIRYMIGTGFLHQKPRDSEYSVDAAVQSHSRLVNQKTRCTRDTQAFGTMFRYMLR